MSRHAARHARAYAAGARDACEAIREAIGQLLPDEAGKVALRRIVDNVRASRFPMPVPNGAQGKIKAPPPDRKDHRPHDL